MGMYTGLKVKAVLKNKFVSPMKKVIENGKFSFLESSMTESELNILKEYTQVERHNHVMSLVGQGTFNNYKNLNQENWDLEGDGPSRVEGNVLLIHGSLKNYDSVIDRFIQDILPIICEKIVYAQSWYEESDTPKDWIK